jgi:hypothetical protein
MMPDMLKQSMSNLRTAQANSKAIESELGKMEKGIKDARKALGDSKVLWGKVNAVHQAARQILHLLGKAK